MNNLEKILKIINSMTKRKEELWLSRIIPVKKGKEKWIISLVNKKKKVSAKDIVHSLNAVNKMNKNAEYWICEKKNKKQWMCTFYPRAKKKSKFM